MDTEILEETQKLVESWKRLAPRYKHAIKELNADAAAYSARLAARPDWVKELSSDGRITVAQRVEHDGLEVEHWTSKSGKEMHRVTWQDGWHTEYTGSLDVNKVEWCSHLARRGVFQ